MANNHCCVKVREVNSHHCCVKVREVNSHHSAGHSSSSRIGRWFSSPLPAIHDPLPLFHCSSGEDLGETFSGCLRLRRSRNAQDQGPTTPEPTVQGQEWPETPGSHSRHYNTPRCCYL